MTPPRTAIVIGGGPAGLIAAAHLADAGIATTLLEASGGLGGRAASEFQDGYALNQGPHALYVGGAARRELKALGIKPPWWNPTSHRSFFFRDGEPKRLPGGTAAFTRWVVGVARTDPAEVRDLTVNEWLAKTLPNSAAARATAGALVRVTTFVADHDTLSADVAVTQIKIGLNPGVRYIKGGWQVMVDALADAARERGATLRTRAGVRAIEPGWTVTTDDETLAADVVIVATGGPGAMEKLLGDRTPAAPGPPAEVSSLDLGLRELPKKSRTFGLGIDAPTYISKHSPGGGASNGGTLMSAIGYTRQPRADLEAVADAHQPGWRAQATLERFLPRQQALTAIATPATGGMAGRPAVDRGDGLFIAGDWIGPEGWLVDSALASGAAAARAAVASRVTAVA
jgi:phytoene dehydrogenase-like protein